MTSVQNANVRNPRTQNNAASAAKKHVIHKPVGNGPAQGLNVHSGDRVASERYTIDANRGSVIIRDRKTNTEVRISGDMLAKFGNGDSLRVENGNVTFQLKDGTKVTLVPTPDGKAIGRAVVTKDNSAVEISNINNTPRTRRLGGADTADAATPDGTVVHAGNTMRDLFAPNGQRFNGNQTVPGAGSTSVSAPISTTPGQVGGTPGQPAPTNPPPANTTPTTPPPTTNPAPPPVNSTPSTPPPANNNGTGNGTGGAGGAGGTNNSGSTGGASETSGNKAVKWDGPEITLANMDEVYAHIDRMLNSGKVTPEMLSVIQMQVGRLQMLANAATNVLKARQDTELAIVRNYR